MSKYREIQFTFHCILLNGEIYSAASSQTAVRSALNNLRTNQFVALEPVTVRKVTGLRFSTRPWLFSSSPTSRPSVEAPPLRRVQRVILSERKAGY